MSNVRLWIAVSLVSALGAACTAGGGMAGDGGGSGDMDGSVPDPEVDAYRPPRPDGASGSFDPFDPDAACGSSSIPTERVPGSLLLVFDRSGSMSDSPRDGAPSKWDLATSAINNVFASLSDDLSAGLLLFPTPGGSDCDVTLSSDVPQVSVAPLSSSRAMIMSTLDSSSPGGGTPMFSAMRAGYDYLDGLTTPGQRGLVLVSDGGESCETSDSEREAMHQQAADELANNNYLTFVVGLAYSNNDLSTIAYNGGTPRNDTCLPECSVPTCTMDSDCDSGRSCYNPSCDTFTGCIPGAGHCVCNTDADCFGEQTCEDCEDPPPPFPAVCGSGFLPERSCEGPSPCCHYNAAESSFQSDFEAALDEIAGRFLNSCVFDVPRGSDPGSFDPNLVNVGVTFDGESRMVLPQSVDRGESSWNYLDTSHESLVIQGPICDRLLSESATVEIALGCPTILI